MDTSKLTDAEAPDIVIESIKATTREEAQIWLDHVDEVFGRDDVVATKRVQNSGRTSSDKSRKKTLHKAA